MPRTASAKRAGLGRGNPSLRPCRIPRPQSRIPRPQSRIPCPQGGSGVACRASGLSTKGDRADGAEGSVSISISSTCSSSQRDRSEGSAGRRAPPPPPPPLLPPP